MARTSALEPGPADGLSVAMLRPLAGLLGQLDVDPAGFLAAVGVDDAMAPETYVPAATVDRVLADLAARRGDPALGLTLARLTTAQPFGLFGHLVWLSGTVRDALSRAIRFFAIVSGRTTITLAEDPTGRALLRLHQPAGAARRGRVLTELPFASLALRTRAATHGAFALRAVRFAHAGEPAAAYAEVFGTAVTFGASDDELEFDARLLELPLASADTVTAAVLEANVAQLTSTARSPLLDRVRRAAAALDGEVTLDRLAPDVGVSPRTLRRQLAREGHTLRTVTDALRRERADALLAAGASVKQVAFDLGFSEPSAFSRAYKRWTGHAPRIASR